VTLQGDGKFEMTQSKYRLSEEQKNGEGQKLFDFCAECLKIFVETNIGSDGEGPIKKGQHLPLGFTVSCIIFLGTLWYQAQDIPRHGRHV
jgi:hexokinase